MKEFNVKVWLPEDTIFCDAGERCRFLLGCNCVLLDTVLPMNSRDQVVKVASCPSLQKKTWRLPKIK